MALEVLERLPEGQGMAPRWRVRCPHCREEYAICAWRWSVMRIRRCNRCASREREYKRRFGARVWIAPAAAAYT